MIKVTKLNNDEIVVNAELIEFVESSPDTIISLTNGKKIMVKETPDEIIKRAAAYRRLALGLDLREADKGETT
ncbi:MAG: flagellar FlbD family protein [candidate division Zixibacteria bacterium]|nr:flagellar FlbD family protein [candidate division Zixibacteria bacterium]